MWYMWSSADTSSPKPRSSLAMLNSKQDIGRIPALHEGEKRLSWVGQRAECSEPLLIYDLHAALVPWKPECGVHLRCHRYSQVYSNSVLHKGFPYLNAFRACAVGQAQASDQRSWLCSTRGGDFFNWA